MSDRIKPKSLDQSNPIALQDGGGVDVGAVGGAEKSQKPGGLEQAVNAHDAAAIDRRLPKMTLGGQAPVQGLSHVAARGFDPTIGPKLFALVPENAPNSVGFVDVLRQLGNSPVAADTVKGLVGEIEARIGLKLPPELVQAALHKPELLTNVMAISPQEMKAGFNALHRTPARDMMKPTEKTRHLPQKFDYADLANTEVTLPKDDLSEVAPGLFRGSVRDPKVSDADAKGRIVLAEVMDRLADNANAEPKDRFSVKYEGGEYTRLSSFLEALADNGHTVEARVDHRVADFMDLKAMTPDGIKSVAAPVFVRSGVEDAKGNEAVIPALHSEIVYTVTPGPDTKGQQVGGEVKWYQGVPNTGFFPANISARGDWTGTITTQRLEGADALRAAQYSGLFSDVINAAASKAERPMAGYGDTGVCIDSVATIMRLMNEEVTAFPLLQGDDLLKGEIAHRLEIGLNRQDAPEYRAISKAIDEVPSDAGGLLAGNKALGMPSSQARALTSLPWAPGKEPFASSMLARQILSA